MKYTLTMACNDGCNDLYWQFWHFIPHLTADRFMTVTVLCVFLSFFPIVACHQKPDTIRIFIFWMIALYILKLALVCKYDQTIFSKLYASK